VLFASKVKVPISPAQIVPPAKPFETLFGGTHAPISNDPVAVAEVAPGLEAVTVKG